jgi:phosphoglycerate kinase
VKLYFPQDFITADKFDANPAVGYATKSEGIPEGWMGLDCGKLSNADFKKAVLNAKTILWNGPAGVFEFEKFAGGTNSLLEGIVNNN